MPEKNNDLRSPDASRGTSMRNKPEPTMATYPDKKITEGERAMAIAEIRYYAAIHMEAIEAMVSGVLLGAEQVQDKRIELIEKKFNPDITEAIFSAVLTIVLEGSIAPLFASILVRGSLAPILRGIATGIAARRSAYFQLQKDLRLFGELADEATRKMLSRKSLGARREWYEQRKIMESLAESLREDLPKERISFGKAKEVGKQLNYVSKILPLEVVAATKAAKERKREVDSMNMMKNYAPVRSVGVEIVAGAFSEASNYRIMWTAAREGTEAALNKPDLKPAEAAKIIERFRPSVYEFDELRARFEIISEAVIWADLLDIPTLNEAEGKYVYNGDTVNKILAAIRGELEDYFKHRFGDAAKEWFEMGYLRRPFEQLLPQMPDQPSGGVPISNENVRVTSHVLPMESGGYSGITSEKISRQEQFKREMERNQLKLIAAYLSAARQKKITLERL